MTQCLKVGITKFFYSKTGTDFMARLNSHLQYFVNKKVSTDPLWQNCSIYLSGHDVCIDFVLFTLFKIESHSLNFQSNNSS